MRTDVNYTSTISRFAARHLRAYLSTSSAERVRKLGGTTLRSLGHIRLLQRVLDNDADFVTPEAVLAELRDDNEQLVRNLFETRGLFDECGDFASASLIENWIDESQRRSWFLFEATRTHGD